MKKIKGFTLIELLVVVAVTGILGVIFTEILTQVLRSQNKVYTINQVKQNGQLVLDKLTNEIRRAEGVICVGDDSSDGDNFNETIVIVRKNIYSKYKLYPPTSELNGRIIRNDFTKEDFPESAYSELCTSNIDYGVPPGVVAYLTNTNPNSGVSLEAAEGHVFEENSPDGYGSIINITFKASAGVKAGSAYETSTKEGGVLFTTSVQVRGLKQ